MATKNIVDQMTALEVARRSSNPDAFTIIETMSMTNTMLQELPVREANDGAVHTGIRRLSYPRGEHRLYNQGVGKKASQTEPIQDVIAMLEAFSDVDEALARQGGNPAALYNSEALAFLAGMGIDQAEDLIYGNRNKNPAEIFGLATRLAFIDGEHCIDFGGTGNNLTSVYLVAPGPNSCHLIYPKGSSSVGVRRDDLKISRVEDPQGKQYMAHTDHFIAEYGLVIAHPDAVIRIANIPVDLTAPQRVDLIEIVLRNQKRLTKGIVNNALFANGDMIYQVERAGREAQQVLYHESDPWSKPVVSINGMRLRQQDAIVSAEERILAA